MKTRALVSAFCLSLLAASASLPGSLQAAGTCDGLPSTLEGGFPNPLFGTSGPDVIVGTANNDRIDGGGGNDVICSGEGDDEVYGFDGQDRIFGEGGADVLDGEEGDDHILGGGSGSVTDEEYDLIVGEDGDDHLDGEGGGDIVFGVGGTDVVLGGEDDDALFGDAPSDIGGTDPDGADTISGGNGVEVLDGGPGADVMDGGPDGASIVYRRAPSAVTVDLQTGTASGGAGNDTFSGIDGVSGSDFNDTLNGSEGSESIEGGPGKDILDGKGGIHDLLSYVSDDGPVTVDLGESTSSGAAGKDKLKNFENLAGSPFADHLTGNDETNDIEGHEGNDVMDGAGGADSINYEAADEAVVVSLAGGTGSVGEGQDQLKNFEAVEGTKYDDQLIGDARDNVLIGGPGDDSLYGRNGSDGFSSAEGSDVIVGGSGVFDYVLYLLADGPVTIDLEAETAVSGANTDILLEIEGAAGSGYEDEIYGDSGENTLAGGPGDDQIDGRGARDQVFFLPGIDPSGPTALSTGPVHASLADGVTHDLADPTEVSGDSLTSIELLAGTEENDVLEGSEGDDSIFGFGGNDEIDTFGGTDSLDGGLGADDLDGGTGIDVGSYFFSPSKVVADLGAGTAVSGGETDTLAGLEALSGSQLNDTLTGDSEENLLVGWNGKDKLVGEEGDDGLLGLGVDIEDLGIEAGDQQDKVLDGGAGTDSCEAANGTNLVSCELDELTTEQEEILGTLIEAIRDIKRKNGVRVN